MIFVKEHRGPMGEFGERKERRGRYNYNLKKGKEILKKIKRSSPVLVQKLSSLESCRLHGKMKCKDTEGL